MQRQNHIEKINAIAQKADAAFKAEHYGRAIYYYTEMIALLSPNISNEPNPLLAKPLTNRAIAYSRKGRNSLALSDFSDAIYHDPYYAPSYVNRGIMRAKTYAKGRAREDFLTAIDVDPGNIAAYVNLCLLFKHANDLDSAIHYATKLTAAKPNLGTAFHLLGHYHYQQFVALDNKRLTRDHRPHPSQTNLGLALKAYVRAIELNDHISNYNLLVLLEANHKHVLFHAIKSLANKDDRIALFEKALDRNHTLGARFWEQEGLSECTLKSGTLKMISDELDKLKGVKAAKTATPVKPHPTEFSLFGRRDANRNDVFNPVTDDKIFTL